MTLEELKALETYATTVATENSVVLIQVPPEELENYASGLNYMNDQFSKRFNIVFIPCPNNVKITVIPAHSEVSLEHEHQA